MFALEVGLLAGGGGGVPAADEDGQGDDAGAGQDGDDGDQFAAVERGSMNANMGESPLTRVVDD